MSARNLKRNLSHFHPEPILLFGKAVGAGAANLTGLVGPGIASINYNAATGKVKITLEDKYNSLLWCDGVVMDATTPDDWEVVIEAETVASTKTITLAIFKGGALTDLTTDETLFLQIFVSNSSRPR